MKKNINVFVFIMVVFYLGCDIDIERDVEGDVEPVVFVSACPATGSQIATNDTIILAFDNTPTDVSVRTDTDAKIGKTVTTRKTVTIHGPFALGELNLTVAWPDGQKTLTYNVGTGIAEDTTEAEEPKGFRSDFTVINWYDDKADLLENLENKRIRISNWSREIFKNDVIQFEGQRDVHHIVVVSMLELGFLENELAGYSTIVERAKKQGLVTMNLETALSLREQFLAQPDYSTGHRLGQFFAAIHNPPIVGEDLFLVIPSLVRDDNFPDPLTGVGLWLIMNAIIFENGEERLFDPLDADGVDAGGRFAFAVPDEVNLDLIEMMEMEQRHEE